MKKVSLIKIDTDVIESVRRAMELAQWKKYIPAQAEVCLKVNLGWDLFIPGSITSPLVVEGVILTIRDWVKKIYLVESNQVLEDIEKAFRKSGMNRLCEKYGVEWVNLSKQKTRKLVNNNNHIFKEVEIAEILLQLPMITIPVMKTHDKTTITGAIKNQWGCISELRHNYHLVLDEALAELNAMVNPRFAVMDATVCLEGNGPKSGNPKIADLVLASGDFVALDTVQARLMGFDPQKIQHIQNCAQRGLGVGDLEEIEIVGEQLGQHIMKFKPAKHNLVSLFELFLRKSPGLRYLFFDTFIFKGCLLLAKMYYQIWTLLKGNGYKRQISQHPVYGKQWKYDGKV
jgi:uncharacterized protein (DUF362 family)